MPERRTLYRIFIASPSDTAQEREIARAVIAEVGRLKLHQGVMIEAYGWENVRPSLGRPQSIINPLVQEADLLIGILWKRFGTSTGAADSGTREEFDLIYKRWQAQEPVDAMLYFRDVPQDMVEDPGPQLTAVLEFRTMCEQIGFYHTYSSPGDFASKLRNHLISWLTSRQAVSRGRGKGKRVKEADISRLARADLTDRFLRSQVAEHAYLQMPGFETRVRMPIQMERVFVPVRARLTEAPLAIKKPASPHGKHKTEGQVGEDEITDFDRAWLLAQRKDTRTLVVLGEPGSGKTTLLRHLLLRCVREPEQIGLKRGAVPLLLPLRLVRPQQDLAQTIQRVLKTDRLRLPEKFFDDPLFSGNAVLLLDGLDEVASLAARTQMARWIEEQHRLHPQCTMIVTARFAGYVSEARLGTPHMELSLERFREAEIQGFLERWFISVETALGEESEFFRQRGREAAADLFARIIAAPEILAMATSPLMLQIIALVHRDRGALPERRVELYDECTNVLIEHWDRAKKGIDIPLTAKEARRVLQPVAYWMHQTPERRYALARDLLPLIRKELSTLSHRKVEAEEFLDTIRDRSGLFIGHGPDQYGFQHLSFQEFLAAGEIRRGERYDELVRHYGESWWREATRLLVGLDDPSCFEPFMRRLVASDRFINNHELTATCIHDAFEPTAKPFADALKAALENKTKGRDPTALQYHLLLALRQLKAEKLGDVSSTIGVAAADARTSEARALALELLNILGITAPVEIDPTTGLPRFRLNPIDGTELALLAGSRFKAGSKAFSDNRPRELELPSFYLARYPVTNSQYRKYLDANPRASKPRYWDDERFNQPQQPVVGVSVEEAESYCKWAGLRLPTEWEWEKGARGTAGRAYPWGHKNPTKELGNFGMSVGQPTPVGSYPKGASPYGLLDMAGNVWEWTASQYEKGRNWRTVRGGSYGSDAGLLHGASRLYDHPGLRNLYVGFRCAQDP